MPPALNAFVLPEILSTEDVRVAFGLKTREGARQLILRTLPHVRLGRKVFVRRQALLDSLAEREVEPKRTASAALPQDSGVVPDWAKRFLSANSKGQGR